MAIEYWGIGAGEGAYARTGVNDSFSEFEPVFVIILVLLTLLSALFPNNTYKAMRIVSPQYDLQYTVWCSNEHELYDMKVRISFLYISIQRRVIAFSDIRHFTID